MTATCPTCGHPTGSFNAFDVVVAGTDGGRAPAIAAAWTFCTGLLAASPDTNHESLRFAEVTAPMVGVAPSTIRNLLLAAERAGVITTTRRTSGTPPRVRAYFRWTGQAPA